MRLHTLVLVLLLGGCSACAPTRSIHLGTGYSDPPIIGIPIDTATHLAAATICDNHNRPIIVVSTTASEANLYYVIEHEKAHVKQIERMEGGCRKFLTRYQSDKEFRYTMELEAYCVGYQVNMDLRGLNFESNYPQFVMWLNNIFPDREFQEIWDDLPCKGGSP